MFIDKKIKVGEYTLLLEDTDSEVHKPQEYVHRLAVYKGKEVEVVYELGILDKSEGVIIVDKRGYKFTKVGQDCSKPAKKAAKLQKRILWLSIALSGTFFTGDAMPVGVVICLAFAGWSYVTAHDLCQLLNS